MNSVTRAARELSASDRSAIEHVWGAPLAEDDQVLLQVRPKPQVETGACALPDWLRVYEGLSDSEIAELERSILDRGHSRP